MLQYQVVLYTGDKPGSVVDYNTYLMITGERGDTGKRTLLRAKADAPEEEADRKADANKVSHLTFIEQNACSVTEEVALFR